MARQEQIQRHHDSGIKDTALRDAMEQQLQDEQAAELARLQRVVGEAAIAIDNIDEVLAA